MYLRTFLTVLSAAALSAAAHAASSCDTPGRAGCDDPAATVAAGDAASASKQDLPGPGAHGTSDRTGQYKRAYALAAASLERALAERQSKLGKDHPFTLATANALALMYKAQDRYGEAELLYCHTLEACERTLGDRHRLTLATVRGLASLYAAQGRHAEAALLNKRAVPADAGQFDY